MKTIKSVVMQSILFFFMLFVCHSYVQAQLSGSSCLGANGGTVCTAGDLQVSGVDVTSVIEGCVNPSDTALVNLTATLVSGSSQRYDVGIWINEDGTSALTGGSCFRDWLPVADGYAEEEGSRADSCGTVLSNTSATRDMFSVTLPCSDIDGDTFGEVSTCLSWKNSARNDCASLADAVPGTGSKCQCGVAEIDGLPIPDLSIAKSCTPDEVLPGETVSCTITITNAAGAGVATNLHFEDDYPQAYGSVSGLNTTAGTASDDGDIIDIRTGDIAAGTTVEVTYDFVVNTADNLPMGTIEDTFTNTVETFYTNESGVVTNQNLSATDDTTVPVTISFVAVEKISYDGFNILWQTQTESGNLGFNILVKDQNSSALQQINQNLIPSKSINSGHIINYEYLSHVDLAGKRIFIQDVDVYGNLKNNGPYFIGEHSGKKLEHQEKIKWAEIRNQSSHVRLDQSRRSKSNGKASSGANDSDTYLIEVEQSGVQRIYYSDIRTAGMSLLSDRSNRLEITDNEVSIPFWVGDSQRGRYIEFVGTANNSLYGDSNYYQLKSGKGLLAKKYQTHRSAVSPVVSNYLKSIRAGDDLYYSALIEGLDPWYDHKLFAINGATAKTYSFTTPDLQLDEGQGSSSLRVILIGSIDFPEDQDHHVEILVNGQLVAEHRFDGFAREIVDVDLDGSLLTKKSPNIVEIRATSDTPRKVDLLLIDSVILNYPALASNITQATIEGSSNLSSATELLVYMETPSAEMIRVMPFVDDNGLYHYGQVNTKLASNSLYVAHEAELYYPEIYISHNEPVSSSSANHLVISHPDFIDQKLHNYLLERSETVLGSYEVINVFDIYAQYSDYQSEPSAIREFVRQSASFGQLQSIMLVGADNYDYKNNLGMEAMSFIPTYYSRTSATVAQAPTDALIADVNRDGLADFPIGRLPVRTAVEIDNLLTKSARMRSRGNVKSALLIADRADTVNEIDFAEDNKLVADILQDRNWVTERIYLENDNIADIELAREAVFDYINGASPPNLVLYNGHSSMMSWSSSGFLNIEDISTLKNSANPFVSMQWGCWNSYFVSPERRTMADALLHSESGAAAVIGASALSKVEDQKHFTDLLHSMLGSDIKSLGELLTEAKKEFSRTYPNRSNIVLGINLLGDPTLAP